MLDPNFIKNYSGIHSLDGTYHKGMVHIWNGRIVLPDLIKKYGLVELSEEKREALSKVLSLIVWGEYAAWQTSNALSFEIIEFGGKMAATSQAHDEARHYFVMCDYIRMVLELPMDEIKVSQVASAGLEAVVDANSLPKRLLGMQLMVEPVAITIFHALRKSEVEPILCELLDGYIRDEARHIALGVRQLPIEIEKMSWPQIIKLFAWQARLLKFEIDGLFELREALDVLGIDYLDVFREAEKRQIDAANDMIEHLGWSLPIESAIRQVVKTYMSIKTSGWM